MEIKTKEISENETEVSIKINTKKMKLSNLLNHLNNFNNEETKNTILLKDEDKTYIKEFQAIWYFESYANKLYAVINNQKFICKNRLYEIESYNLKGFIRVSKSVIINISFINYFQMEFSGNYTITLQNNQKITLSRNYVKQFKNYIKEEM